MLILFSMPVVLSFLSCEGTMDGDQAQGAMRGMASGLDPDDQRRLGEASNDFRSVPDPAALVDGYVNPCPQCEEDGRAARGIPPNATALERTYAQMGGQVRALRQARCFISRHGNSTFRGGEGTIRLGNRCKMAINEHAGRGVRGNKMFIVDQCTGEIKVMNVTRGSAGIGAGTGQTTPGFHISAGWHHSPSGKNWSPGIKMVGLQEGVNDSAWGRGVVMHRAIGYCSGGMNSSRSNPRDVGGDCGRSNGCPAVDPANWNTVVNDLLGNRSAGNLVFNYTNRERDLGDNYCGDRLKRVGAQ